MKLLTAALLFASALAAQPRHILYITHSAGYRHESIPHSADVLRSIGQQDGRLDVTVSDDVSLLNAATLAAYDAVLFFTSGELPVSEQQKADLLAYVRAGHGVGGFHSATDTFYAWPEYGRLIGAYFNGHPWTQEVTIGTEDTSSPIVSHLNPGLRIRDEIYQFRDLDRSRVNVLLKLDTASVDLHAEGVNPGTYDFPLAWTQQYGSGRVFYSALGHFAEAWDDPGIEHMLLEAMLWLTGQIEARSRPFAFAPPKAINTGNSASLNPLGAVSPGTLFTIYGENLSTGDRIAADATHPPTLLGGTAVIVNGRPVPLLYTAWNQINAFLPLDLEPNRCPGGMPGFCKGPTYDVTIVAGGQTSTLRLDAAALTPGIFFVPSRYTIGGTQWLTYWMTGLGSVERRGDFYWTTEPVSVTVNGQPAAIEFSGLAPGYYGLYQVNVALPRIAAYPVLIRLQAGGYTSSTYLFE